MDTCILYGKPAGDAPTRGVVQTGWLAGSTVVGVDRGPTPNERVITSRLSYAGVREHPVAFCAGCWIWNGRLWTGVKWILGLCGVGVLGIVVLLILQGNGITDWAAPGVTPLLFLIAVYLPLAQAISPANRALKKVRTLHAAASAGGRIDT